MSRQINFNHSDSAVGGVSSLTLPISVLNYAADWGVKDGVKGETWLVNNTSPIDRPERIRLAVASVPDIYAGTGIDPNLFMDSKRGVSLVCQLTEVATVTDTVNTSFERVSPISAHIVLKLPVDAVLTADQVKAIVGRLCSTMFDTGVVTSARLGRMLRGSLLPSDL